MGACGHPSQAVKPARKGKSKVKSGCRTCKIRRIKCDEGRPACQRCVFTGRVCDGYGVWGGGGSAYGQHTTSPKPACTPNQLSQPINILREDPESRLYFGWFRSRSAVKLPGAFGSTFWNELLFQASAAEPVVLHAILALSATHKKESSGFVDPSGPSEIPDEREQFTLRHYNKAIGHLCHHFPDKSRESVNIALITCAAFIFLEFLRGNYVSGINHLKSGLSLLAECRLLPSSSQSSPIDARILETFTRLNIQSALFGQGYQYLPPDLPALECVGPNVVFPSVNHAKQHLYAIFNDIFHLDERSRRINIIESSIYRAELLGDQERLRNQLRFWDRTYYISRAAINARATLLEEFAYRLLRNFYCMASIMAETCVDPSNQLAFDSHAPLFQAIIAQSLEMQKIVFTTSIIAKVFGPEEKASGSVSDIGGRPALYFTAVKCRVHRLRHQALRMLTSTSHKEGLWDARIVAAVARKVIEVEERDFYSDIDQNKSLDFLSSPENKDLALPTLPERYRLKDVQVILPNSPTGIVSLKCAAQCDDETRGVFEMHYNLRSREWLRENSNILKKESTP